MMIKLRLYLLLKRLLFWLRNSENSALLLLACIVGIFTGIGVWIFRTAIEFFHQIFQEQFSHEFLGSFLGVVGVIVGLAAAGLIVGFLMEKFVGHEKYHGVAGIMESVAYTGGRLPFRKMPAKALASAISLGAGASVGPEDPSVQIGANWGSFIGQILHLSEDRVKLLVAAGGAAAIAAAFKAPIAGVFFALEVILNNTFASNSVGVIVLSAVISSAFTQAVEPHPEMGPFHYIVSNPIEFPLYVPLGILMAPLAVSFIRLVYWQHDLWHKYLHHLSRPVKTALAGALIGAVGIFIPEIMGTGRETMNTILSGEGNYILVLLFAMGVIKIITTAVSMAGGFVGGIFAPSLFVGTTLGAAYGQIVTRAVNSSTSPETYAIAGMAAMMAGVVRAPITAIMMVFELTNDYRLILPIMLTTVVCFFISLRMEKNGIYTHGLLRQGVSLPEGRDVDLMQGVTVGEAMISPAPSISEDASLVEIRNKLREHHTMSLCVLDKDGLLSGIVTLSDLQQAYDREDHNALTAKDIYTRDVATTTSDEVLWKAIRTMCARDVGRLPVVKPGTREVVGLIGRHGVVRAYNIVMNRKLQDQHTIEQIRLHTLTGAHVFEAHVYENAPIVGKHISEVQWPAESVVAAIQRKGKLLIPHGSTEIVPNDILTIVADPRLAHKIQVLTGEKT